MSTTLLLRTLARIGVGGGALRLVCSVAGLLTDHPGLEALYVVTDLGLLGGTLAIYLHHHEELGKAGLAVFLVTTGGIAFITGPDAPVGPTTAYQIGAPVVGVGFALLGGLLLRAGVAPRGIGAGWIGAVGVGLGGMTISGALGAGLFAISGALFAGAFLWACLDVLGKLPDTAPATG